MRLWLRARLWLQVLEQHPSFWAVVMLTALLVAAALAVTRGAVELSLAEIGGALTRGDHPMRAVVWDVRMPRVAAGMAVGAALAVAGALMQTVVRNPLADPGIVGVSAGAGIGALVAILFFPEQPYLVPLVAFAGAFATVTLLLVLAWTGSRSVGPLRIVLSGVALQALFFAVIALLTFAFADRAPAFASFMVGSLNGLGWSDFGLVAVPTVIGLVLALLLVRALNLLLLDDTTAGGLGLGVRRSRLGASCISALLAAGAVSVAGLVGFVGLVVPNGVRLLVGPDHRLVLPLAAVGGSVLVLLADTVARVALSPLELPVGALLAMVGGPYFLYLLRRKLT